MSVEVSEAKSWTDDLPVCFYTGVGLSKNQIYKEDGYRREAHECEDRSFHFKIDDHTFLYGVFNGKDGSSMADFAAQRMPAEILLGQLSDKDSPEAIKEVLREAFLAVERSYFESVDDLLAERANLLCELPDGFKSYDAYQQFPDIVNRLRAANARLSAGASVAIALIFKGHLYVANVGDCRALLCKIDAEGVLRVMQLTVDHDLTNEDELLRLSHMGIDVEKLQKKGSHLATRCLGNYNVKGGYKDFDLFSAATREPVIAEAEIMGPIALDDSCRFLLLMTQGLYGALEEATKSEQANKEIAQIVVEQFGSQSTLAGVAQGVVDRIVRIHHDHYMKDPSHLMCCQHEDITLLIRNFNFQLSSPASASSTLRSYHPSLNANTSDPFAMGLKFDSQIEVLPSSSINGTLTEIFTEASITSSDSSEQMKSNQSSSMFLDDDGRIAPYVDFSSFYQAVKKAKDEGTIPENAIY